MHIGDERNRPCVVDYVQGIRGQANHYRYSPKYSIRWKSGVDPQSSEVYGYQKVGKYIPKGTVEHDHCNVSLILDKRVGVWRVSDRAEVVNGNYSNSDRMSRSMGSQ